MSHYVFVKMGDKLTKISYDGHRYDVAVASGVDGAIGAAFYDNIQDAMVFLYSLYEEERKEFHESAQYAYLLDDVHNGLLNFIPMTKGQGWTYSYYLRREGLDPALRSLAEMNPGLTLPIKAALHILWSDVPTVAVAKVADYLIPFLNYLKP